MKADLDSEATTSQATFAAMRADVVVVGELITLCAQVSGYHREEEVTTSLANVQSLRSGQGNGKVKTPSTCIHFY